MHYLRKTAVLMAWVAALALSLAAQGAQPPPLPIEKTGIIEKLPRDYPADWFLVHEVGFFNMSDGKVYVIDTSKDTLPEQVQGTFNISFIGNYIQSAKRGEIYAVETFHERGTRGKRIDVLTIWDQENLSPVAEIMLQPGKRFMGLPPRNAMLLLNYDRWLAITNFSPATSVTLIDVEKREIIAEIPTPGCLFTYPAGNTGFSSLCADGRFMSTQLDRNGKVIKQVRTEPFFNSDDTPIFERPAIIGNMAYFPSFSGLVHPVDVGGQVAEVGEAWNLVPESERAANWAPAGLGIAAEDDQGHFYILMHPDAKEGSHQGGGPEVWVFDPAKKARVRRIALNAWGLSLGVSRGPNPKLMVLNPIDMSLEMYNAQSGEFIRTISGFGEQTPLFMRGAK
jgi:methylamine dehydrogenase heavy chain